MNLDLVLLLVVVRMILAAQFLNIKKLYIINDFLIVHKWTAHYHFLSALDEPIRLRSRGLQQQLTPKKQEVLLQGCSS